MSLKITLNQTHHQLADLEAIAQTLMQDVLEAQRPGKGPAHLLVYPEMYLSGYPLADLCYSANFIERFQKHLGQLHQFFLDLNADENLAVLVGGPEYELDAQGQVKPNGHLYNSVFLGQPGKGLRPIYRKLLLPNYDIFDEKKYFSEGHDSKVLEFAGHKVALLICEDMWFSSHYKINPVEKLSKMGVRLDLIVNLSASPFNLGKQEQRLKRAEEACQKLGAPMAYVNRVGAEDEILFDGQSFFLNYHAKTQAWVSDILPIFTAAKQSFTLEKDKQHIPTSPLHSSSLETLFKPRLNHSPGRLPRLDPLSAEDCEDLIQALEFGLLEYARKCGFKKFLVALSGGMDSGLVVTLISLFLKKQKRSPLDLEVIYMPSQFSAPLSLQLSQELCLKLEIPLHVFPIKFLHSMMRNQFAQSSLGLRGEISGLTDENLQSRLRGLLLYTCSNQTGAMVVNTSNKSELSVGYSTQYGDSVGAISLLGDLYKTEVYALAEYINLKHGDLIPRGFIERAPSAELREDQKDQDSLPPYARLDAILESMLGHHHSTQGLIDLGFPEDEVKKVFRLFELSEFKRKQFCPILKVKAKSFGFGHRLSITKKFF